MIYNIFTNIIHVSEQSINLNLPFVWTNIVNYCSTWIEKRNSVRRGSLGTNMLPTSQLCDGITKSFSVLS